MKCFNEKTLSIWTIFTWIALNNKPLFSIFKFKISKPLKNTPVPKILIKDGPEVLWAAGEMKKKKVWKSISRKGKALSRESPFQWKKVELPKTPIQTPHPIRFWLWVLTQTMTKTHSWTTKNSKWARKSRLKTWKNLTQGKALQHFTVDKKAAFVFSRIIQCKNKSSVQRFSQSKRRSFMKKAMRMQMSWHWQQICSKMKKCHKNTTSHITNC